MEHYNVILSERANADIRAAIRYIAVELRNPQAAGVLLDKFDDAIQSLDTMPERVALVSDDYLASRGFRMIAVGNYLLFYIVNRQERVVNIPRVLYGRRNWRELLNNQESLE